MRLRRTAAAVAEALSPFDAAQHDPHALPCACTGGTLCGYENPATQQGGSAIAGLHSSWVGDRILALARPWHHYTSQFGIVDAFVRHNIGLLLNLQEVGEHGGCGPGNLSTSGLSYEPDAFQAAGIAAVNMGWRDMSVPAMDQMLDIVQLMEHVLTVQQRKVAVHSHTGLGRTGLAIACFMVWTCEHNPRAAVAAVRKFRPGALMASPQQVYMYVAAFQNYLEHLRCTFKPHPSPASSTPPSLPQSVGGTYPAAGPGSGPMAGSTAVPQVKVDSHGNQTELYPNGLTIVRAVSRQGSRQGSMVGGGLAAAVTRLQGSTGRGGTQGAMDYEAGIDKTRPWSVRFRSTNQAPDPPSTYEEALMRQVRLKHGADRHNFLHLHAFVKQAVFAVMHAAGQHFWQAGGQPGHLLQPWQLQQQWQAAPLPFSPPPASLVPLPGAYSGGIGTAGPLPAPPATFAHAVCMFITDAWRDSGEGREGPTSPDLLAMAGSPVYSRFVGAAVSSTALAAALANVKQQANLHRFEVLSTSPLAVVLMALDDFFSQLDPSVPSLSLRALQHMCETYVQLPYDPTPGFDESAQVMAAATAIIAPLPPADQELLLLLSAMLRHIVRASSRGCEASIAQICSWLARLLLGKFDSKPAVEEALCCYLWCLTRNDIVYSAAILCKSGRLSGAKQHEPGPTELLGPMFEPAGGVAWHAPAWVPAADLQAQQALKSEASMRRLLTKAVPGLSWILPNGSSWSAGGGAQGGGAHGKDKPRPRYKVQLKHEQDYEVILAGLHPLHPLRLELEREYAELKRAGLPPGERLHSEGGPESQLRRMVHAAWA